MEAANDRIIPMDLDWRNPYSASELSMAVRARNVTLVKKLLRKGLSPNAPDNRGWTPLHDACKDNSFYEIVRILLANGAYVEHKTFNGETALFIASKYKAKLIVRYLINHGANVNSENHECVTPLHVACKGKSDEVVKLLIDAGAHINATDDEERTPIYIALKSVNVAAIRTLLKAGADMRTKDFFSRTPLHYACMIGNMEIFELLLKHTGYDRRILNQQTPEGWTLLMEATQYKNYKIVEWLIKCGIDTTLVDNRKLLALHIAAHCGELNILEVILRNTPINIIEKYSTLYSGFMTHYRSLPCLIIDKNLYEGLELLFTYGLSAEVLKCPAKMGTSLVSPISFLILHANGLEDNEKIKYLDFLLNYDFLKQPEYELDLSDSDIGIITPIEAAVSVHRPEHEDCSCSTFLSMLLERGVSPDQTPLPLQRIGSQQLNLYMKCIRFGFMSGLELLLIYSNITEPWHVLHALLTDIAQASHLWTDEEPEAVKCLLEKCTTELTSAYSIMCGALDREDNYRYTKVLPIYKLTKKALCVISLKRLCRGAIRSYFHEVVEGSLFRQSLSSLNLPVSLIRFLKYETEF